MATVAPNDRLAAHEIAHAFVDEPDHAGNEKAADAQRRAGGGDDARNQSEEVSGRSPGCSIGQYPPLHLA